MRFRALALTGTAFLSVLHWASPVQAQDVVDTRVSTEPGIAQVPILTDFEREFLLAAQRHPGRIDPSRDQWRNPVATLQFFGVRPGDTVIEVWPGQGWYTSILKPYLQSGGGRLIVGHFDPDASNSPAVRRIIDTFSNRFAQPGSAVEVRPFGAESGQLAPPGSVDSVLTFRNVHNWMAQGWAEKAFADFFTVLKPGGILGIEEHRLDVSEPQDPVAATGYVREDYIIALAEEAGFEFIGSSEINANPRDTRDHPFGVWTLPPVRRSSPLGMPDDPRFDHSPYDRIGESDRMTLRFRKPLNTRTPPVRPGPPAIQAASPPPGPVVVQAGRDGPPPASVMFGGPAARATAPTAGSPPVASRPAVVSPPAAPPADPGAPVQPIQPIQPIQALPPPPVRAAEAQPARGHAPDWRPVPVIPPRAAPPPVSPPPAAPPAPPPPPPPPAAAQVAPPVAPTDPAPAPALPAGVEPGDPAGPAASSPSGPATGPATGATASEPPSAPVVRLPDPDPVPAPAAVAESPPPAVVTAAPPPSSVSPPPPAAAARPPAPPPAARRPAPPPPAAAPARRPAPPAVRRPAPPPPPAARRPAPPPPAARRPAPPPPAARRPAPPPPPARPRDPNKPDWILPRPRS